VIHGARLLLFLCIVLLCASHASAGPGDSGGAGPFEPPRLTSDAPRPTWPRRHRRGVKGMRGKGQGLIDLKRWPAEPPSPDAVEPERLARALRELCASWMPSRRPLRYTGWILQYSQQFDVDPFLVAALLYRQSRCIPTEKNDYGVGIAMINAGMHASFIRRRRYGYSVLQDGAWRPRELVLDRFALVPGNLRRAEPGIYFAAALLSMWKAQCPAIDGAFGSVPHRHFVSHFMWGDRVDGSGAEDRVLRARRRLIQYYLDRPHPPLGRFQLGPGRELALRCPLDGWPRKVTSGMGSDRDDGKRFHRGVDFGSTWGEPVRAVAGGKVVVAGLDRKTGGPINVEPEEAGKIRRSEMGPGGLFVMLRHEGGLISAYMHLASYSVKVGQSVTAGQPLGLVGKTGIRESGAHLHFELRFGGRHVDPMPHLQPYVLPPDASYLGRRVLAEEKRVRRRRRIQRWRERKGQAQTPVKAVRQ